MSKRIEQYKQGQGGLAAKRRACFAARQGDECALAASGRRYRAASPQSDDPVTLGRLSAFRAGQSAVRRYATRDQMCAFDFVASRRAFVSLERPGVQALS